MVENVVNNSIKVYIMDIVLFGNDIIVDIIYRVVWVIFGNFIFFILLVGFNICICRKIYKFY